MSHATVSRRSVLGAGLAAAVLAGCGKTEWFTPEAATVDLPPKSQRLTVQLTRQRGLKWQRTTRGALTDSVEFTDGDDGGVFVRDLRTGKQ